MKMLPFIAALVLLVVLHGSAGGVSAQDMSQFVPVGVHYRTPADPVRQRRDLEEMQRLRFNAIAPEPDAGAGGPPLLSIEALLAGATPQRVLPAGARPASLSVDGSSTAPEIGARAWAAFASTGGVVFADWASLLANPDALGAAAEFAAAIARNEALYAPLRPIPAGRPGRTIVVDAGGAGLSATLLESSEALVLIAVNLSAHGRTITLKFSPDIPEAIWQNMLTGGAVNFLAGAAGPIYERTFAPYESVVLMIRTQLR